MPTALYDTDVQKITDRTAKTTLADTDVLVVANSSGTLAPITKVNTKETLGINANATAITTLNGDVSTAGSVLKVVKDNAQDATFTPTGTIAATDIKGAIAEVSLDVDKLNNTVAVEGSVLKSIKDNAQNATYDPAISGLTATTVKTAIDELADEKADTTTLNALESRVDTNELTLATAKTGIDLLEKAVNSMGSGTTIDTTDIETVAMPKNAVGRALTKIFGRTATNLVSGSSIANLGTVTFASVLDHKYFDSLHWTILTGTGSDMTVTNDTGAVADIMVIPLTLIFSTVPSASDCVKFFQAYFANTQSVHGPFRLRSRGSNLFDKYKPIVTQARRSDTGVMQPISNVYSTQYIHIAPSTSYYLYGFGNIVTITSVAGVSFYDKDKIYISGVSSGNNTKSFTTPNNAKYLIFNFIAGTIDSIQLNLGSTALPYEPYKSLDQYIADATVIRSIQDVTDTFEWIDGELWHGQKVSTPQAVISGVAVNVTNYPTAKTGGKWVNELTAGGTEVGVVGTDSTTGAGSLRFELSTPVYTKLTTSGVLQAFAQGDVSIEPFYEGSHQTDASSEITLPYEGTIEVVYGYDENSDEYLLTSSEYSLTGTTLTITGATENEVYYVKLARDYVGITPQMTVNSLNNDVVTLDTVDGKYYKVGFTTASGVPSLTATEVV